jgi:hypothetical protein
MQSDGLFSEETMIEAMRESQKGMAVVLSFIKKAMENRHQSITM